MSARKYFLTPDELQIIKDNYDGRTIKINKIMRLLNFNGYKYPRWFIRKIAAENGLARAMSPDWNSQEEEWLIENYPKKGFAAIQKSLKKINGGISRSRTAIVLKAKRLEINKRSDGLTMRMMESLLGADHKKIQRWLSLGLLTAKRKGTDRVEIQGGDMWHFEPSKVREFIINNPEEIDLRRVESMSFIHLVAGMM